MLSPAVAITIMVATVLLLCACAAHAATETDRLLTLARVWSTVKYLDPLFVSSDVDWDAALIHAIPKVRAAANDDEFANAVESMLSELHDPATRVERAKAKQKSTADVKLFRWDDRDVLVINAGPFIAANDVNDVLQIGQGAFFFHDDTHSMQNSSPHGRNRCVFSFLRQSKHSTAFRRSSPC